MRSASAEKDLILRHTRGFVCAGGREGLARGAAYIRAEADPTVRYYTAERLGLSAVTVQTYLETRMIVAYIPTNWCGSRKIPSSAYTPEGRMYQYLQILAPRFAEMEAQMFAAVDAADPHPRRRHALAAFGVRTRRLCL